MSKENNAYDFESYTKQEITKNIAFNTECLVKLATRKYAPFYSYVISSFKKVITNELPTAAVGFRNGKFWLYINPFFMQDVIKEKGEQGLAAVMIHEVMHVLNHHLFPERMPFELVQAINKEKKEKDKALGDWDSIGDQIKLQVKHKVLFKLFNVAADLAINSYISNLPSMGCIPGQSRFENYPSGKSAEWYFRRLMKDEDIESQLDEIDEFDIHIISNGSQEDEINDSEKELKRILVNAKRSSEQDNKWGDLSQHERKLISDFIQPQINWKQALRFFVKKSIKGSRSSSWRSVSRKQPYLKPGRVKGYVCNIIVAVDMSGSVSDEDLAMFSAELNSLSKECNFIFLPFDTEPDIENMFQWKKGQKIQIVRTRSGGTDFDAPTKFVNQHKKKMKIDGLVVLTDLEAPKPVPCVVHRMWIKTPGRDSSYFDPTSIGERCVELA